MTSETATPKPPVRRRGLFVKILLVLLLLLAGFAVVVAMQPAEFRIERTTRISAPPAAVFARVNDMHRWDAWSPWEKVDPGMKRSYSGAEAGQGAVYAWSGNNEVGAGSMTIIESRPNELVRIRLDFERPFRDTSIAEFTFRPDGNQTVVTWTMDGKKNFVSKAVCLFMDMDKMVGGMFEKGLTDLKTVVEGEKRAK